MLALLVCPLPSSSLFLPNRMIQGLVAANIFFSSVFAFGPLRDLNESLVMQGREHDRALELVPTPAWS